MRAVVFRTTTPRLLAALVYARVTGRPTTSAWGPLALLDVPEPALPGERWVRVRTRMSGICGSDLHMLRIQVSPRSSVLAMRNPRKERLIYPGHETVGEIIEAGSGVRELRVGQRVVQTGRTFCAVLERDPCEFCRRGEQVLCENRHRKTASQAVGGGWSEQFVCHEAQLLALPDSIPDGTAVLFEPASCAVHSVLRQPPSPGDKVLVVGGGMIGLATVAALRALGVDVHITVIARHRFQAERAGALRADEVVAETGGDVYEKLGAILRTQVLGRAGNRILKGGFHLVYDCVGSAATLNDSLRWVRARGNVVLMGINMYPGQLDRSPLWHRAVGIVGAMGYGNDELEGRRCTTFERVVEWVERGRLSLEGLLTHRFALSDYQQAIATSAGKSANQAIKVAFDFDRR